MVGFSDVQRKETKQERGETVADDSEEEGAAARAHGCRSWGF